MALQEKSNIVIPTAKKGSQTAPAGAQPPGGDFRDKDMQAVIGWILRLGVTASTVFVIIGGILFLYRHGHSQPDFHDFKKVPDFISSPRGVIEGVVHLKGQAIIQLGIVLLIATPIMRVLFACIAFLMEKDYLYTFISVLVLLIIVASMISGHTG